MLALRRLAGSRDAFLPAWAAETWTVGPAGLDFGVEFDFGAGFDAWTRSCASSPPQATIASATTTATVTPRIAGSVAAK